MIPFPYINGRLTVHAVLLITYFASQEHIRHNIFNSQSKYSPQTIFMNFPVAASTAIFIFLGALRPALSITHLHLAPGVLSGSIVTDGLSSSSASNPLQIKYEAEITQNVLLYEEMNKDGISIENCIHQNSSTSLTLYIRGNSLDRTDYIQNSYLLVGKEKWFEACGHNILPNSIDASDDILFLMLEKDGFQTTACVYDCVKLELKFAFGGIVVPVVTLSISEIQTSSPTPSSTGTTQKFLQNSFTGGIVESHRNDASSPCLSDIRATNATLNLSAEISLTVETRMSSTISNFRITRYSKLAAQWEQTFSAFAGVTLSVKGDVSFNKTGDLKKIGVPSFGFSLWVPFIGDITAGAVIKFEYVLEFDATAEFTASYGANFEQVDEVNAQLFPPSYSATNVEAQNGKDPNGDITVGPDASASIRISGFVGVRASLGLELSIGNKGVAGNVGATFGLELSVEGRAPPFNPFSGPGLILGSCDVCHIIRAQLAIVGKDIDIHLILVSKPVIVIIILKLKFRFPIGTWCILPVPQLCTPSPSMSIEPTQSSSKGPSKSPCTSLSPTSLMFITPKQTRSFDPESPETTSPSFFPTSYTPLVPSSTLLVPSEMIFPSVPPFISSSSTNSELEASSPPMEEEV